MNEFPAQPVSEPLEPEPRPENEEVLFWTAQDLLVLTGLAIPAMILAALLVQIVVAMVPAGDEVPAAGVLAAQFISYGLWFFCLYALLKFKYDRAFWPSMAWNKPPRHIIFYAAIGPVLAVAVGYGGNLLQTPEIDMPMMKLMNDRFSLIMFGAFAVTLGPLCEEIVFRGFYLPRLAKSLGPVAGVLITSVVFAMLHGPQYGWSWQHILLISTAGVAFCLVRLRTNSTAAATVMHATYNLTIFVAYLTQLEASGATW